LIFKELAYIINIDCVRVFAGLGPFSIRSEEELFSNDLSEDWVTFRRNDNARSTSKSLSDGWDSRSYTIKKADDSIWVDI
jgi:hypothetical protein